MMQKFSGSAAESESNVESAGGAAGAALVAAAAALFLGVEGFQRA